MNNEGIIHFGFTKQIAPDFIEVGTENGSTTSEQEIEQTGSQTENQANGNSGNGNNGNNGKGKGNGKNKGKLTGTTSAARKKATYPKLPYNKNHPLRALAKKGFK